VKGSAAVMERVGSGIEGAGAERFGRTTTREGMKGRG